VRTVGALTRTLNVVFGRGDVKPEMREFGLGVVEIGLGLVLAALGLGNARRFDVRDSLDVGRNVV
jgi:hypothetical protein